MKYALVVIVLAGCVEAQLLPCGPDVLCPANTICLAELSLCVTEDQLAVCEGQTDGTICNASGTLGECRDGVCLVAICGDHFVEPGEACDDGNRISSDGCNAGCSSTEICGNGQVDIAQGEQCDDGNTISADGCDSLCRFEQVAWSLDGITPMFHLAGEGGYDVAHRQLLHVTEGITWTWDGARWSIVSSSGLPRSLWRWMHLVYAPDRMAMVLIGAIGVDLGTSVLHAWEWDGTAWHETPIAGTGPLFTRPLATYDTVRNVVLVAGAANSQYDLWSLDLGAGTWTQRASAIGPNLFNTGFAFDEARGRAVLARCNGSTTDVQEWTGTAWTAAITSSFTDFGTLTYDPNLGRVISVGNKLASWNGATWSENVAGVLPAGRFRPTVAFDRERQRLFVFGGETSSVVLDDLYEWNGTAWTANLRAWPKDYDDVYFAFDPRGHRLVSYGRGTMTGILTWAYDGTWRQLAQRPYSGGGTPSATAIAWDPVRGGFVSNGSDGGTWLLRDETWETLVGPATSTPTGLQALTYDPLRGGVVGTSTSATWLLPSIGAQWMMLGAGPILSSLPGSIAFDARTKDLVMTGIYAGASLFAGQAWVSTVSAGNGFTVVANERRGTVELLAATRPAYERVDGTWLEREHLPFAIAGQSLYDASTGDLWIIGTIDHARLIARRTTVGAAPPDACTGGDDDGDGLVDCDDPECWWSCGTCPPLTTCP